MDAFSDPKVTELVGVFASQVGKTDCLLNIIGQRIASAPGPILMIQPTLGMAESWSKDRLAPMLRDTPVLKGKVKDARSRDSGNTVLHKIFAGGHLTAAGANSPASLAMRPIRDAFFDEVDRYPPSAGTEGDPLKLAEARTRAFWNAKKVYISSPGTMGASRLEIVWNRSDQRFYYVPCHDCGTRQTLKWTQVHWDKDEEGEHRPETARYVCEACGAGWNDLQRRAATRKGEWRPTRPFTGCAGFHINALAAPWESCNLENLVRQWLEAQGNPNLLKPFVNTVLAEWWSDDHAAKGVDETGLLARRETFEYRGERAVVPAGVALLTAGIDIQDNRIEAVVYGYAHGEESWRLGKVILYGDPSSAQVWEDLDRFLLAPWPRAAGGVDFIRGASVDTGGHHTQAAYDFCSLRHRRVTPDGGRAFLFAVKGSKGAGEVWPRAHSTVTQKVPLWIIRVDPAKEQIYGRLSIAEHGPGFLHLGMDLTAADAASLVAERMRPKVNKRSGFTEREWFLPSGKRNEELDCAVYAYAALCGLRSMGYDLETAVLELPNRVVIEAGELRQPQAASGQPQATPSNPRPSPGAGSWLGDTNGWLR